MKRPPVQRVVDVLERGRQFSFGEYGRPPKEERLVARLLFFRAIESIAPQVIENLKKLLPIYKKLHQDALRLWNRAGRVCPSEPKSDRWLILTGATKRNARLRPLVAALQKWANGFHLNERWILDLACWNLEQWRLHPDRHDTPRWNYPGSLTYESSDLMALVRWILHSTRSDYVPERPTIAIEPDGSITDLQKPRRLALPSGGVTSLRITWPDGSIETLPAPAPPAIPAYHPVVETRRAYLKATRRALITYVEQVERALEEKGFRRKVRTRGGQSLRKPFDWLVEYQVRGRSYAQIGNDARKSERFISRKVRKVAERIDLQLREPSTGGHPPYPHDIEGLDH